MNERTNQVSKWRCRSFCRAGWLSCRFMVSKWGRADSTERSPRFAVERLEYQLDDTLPGTGGRVLGTRISLVLIQE